MTHDSASPSDPPPIPPVAPDPGGARLKAFPTDIMEASWQAANDVYREIAAQDANFQRLHDAYIAFRNDQYLWWQVAEYPYDNFLIRQRTKG